MRFVVMATSLCVACGGSPAEAPAAPVDVEEDTAPPVPLPPGMAIDEPEDAEITFTDVTGLLGLKPSRVNGVALVDYDGDGDVDVSLGDLSGIRLYRNEGDGTFEDVSKPTGLYELFLHTSRGLTWADLDGDGDLDVYVTRLGPPDAVLINDGGRFENVAAEWGIAEIEGESEGASAGDLDGDGDLDVYVSISRILKEPAVIYGAPNRYWRNDGGLYTDATVEANLGGREDGYSFGSLLFDVEPDGDVDVFVVHDGLPDELLLNDGQGRFTSAGIDWLPDQATGLMGLDLGDLDGDGMADIYATNWGPDYILQRSTGTSPAFRDVMRRAIGEGFDPTAALVGWGCALADLDDDGDPDVISTASFTDAAPAFHVPRGRGPSPSLVTPGAVVVLENRGGDLAFGSLADVTAEAGPRLGAELNGFGLATGDIDGDGDLDALVGVDHELGRTVDATDPAIRHVSLLLRNDGRRAHAHRSLQLRLVDPGSPNPFAVGARVRVQTGSRWQVRYVLAGASFLSTQTYELHFGLGAAERPDLVEIVWPGGATETRTDLTAGRHTITRVASR